MLMSAVSLYYYFRIVVQMFMQDGSEAETAALIDDRWTGAMIGLCAVVTLAVGIYPGPVIAWAKGGLQALGMG